MTAEPLIPIRMVHPYLGDSTAILCEARPSGNPGPQGSRHRVHLKPGAIDGTAEEMTVNETGRSAANTHQ